MRILFVHNYPTRFVKIDRDLLAERYQVSELYEESLSKLRPVTIWKQVKKHDLIFCWFASWHSFFPVLFAQMQNKPSIVVIGGYDVANMPNLKYGHQRGGLRRYYSRIIMQKATALITNSQFSLKEAVENAKLSSKNIRVVYHGVPDTFGDIGNTEREMMVLTVGEVKHSNLLRKGHEVFVKVAKMLPKIEFHLVGKWSDQAVDYLSSIASPNVNFTGWLEDKKLQEYYKQASVYVQASAHEGFGLSVAESMLAGCIPVVTRTGALPEVVGNCGVYSRSHNPTELAEAISKALNLNQSIRQRARRRILEKFPLERRREEIYRLVEGIRKGRF